MVKYLLIVKTQRKRNDISKTILILLLCQLELCDIELNTHYTEYRGI